MEDHSLKGLVGHDSDPKIFLNWSVSARGGTVTCLVLPRFRGRFRAWDLSSS